MGRALRAALVAALIVLGAVGGARSARAEVSGASADNLQDGSNRSSTTQSGSGKSGDGVGGQVVGVVSSGRTSVDARNHTQDSDVSSGEARGTNSASSFTGLNRQGDDSETTISDVTDSCHDSGGCDNLQDGSNRSTISQAATATTGDGVAGEVIGVVSRGSTSIVASNRTVDSSVDTGNAEADNDAAAFVGLQRMDDDSTFTVVADVESSCFNSRGCDNLQDGNNRLTGSQRAAASSGDGVAGQVIGAVSGSGNASIDATNASDGVDVTTGDGDAANHMAAFVGLARADDDSTVTVIADVTDSCHDARGCDNLQDGNNSATLSQSARSASGDGVAGEVIGLVGDASVVAANRSIDSSVDTGDAEATNDLAAFVGLNRFDDRSTLTVVADVENSCHDARGCDNLQDGNNTLRASQSAHSTTGDGVAGQVIGVVSAGATSVDARNLSDGVDISTGNADAHNDADVFVGLARADDDSLVDISDVTVSCHDARGCDNLQDGSNRASVSQRARAGSGDGVGGEVIGVVTSAGGSASVVAANTTRDSSVDTGNGDASNDLSAFVGLFRVDDRSDLVLSDIDSSCHDSRGCDNLQDGNNRLTGGQSATATSGDGVAGQVLGVVSAGAASVDATNATTDSDVSTGNADAHNDAAIFVGLLRADDDADVLIGDVSNSCTSGGDCDNLQDGNNSKTFSQSADATSGDAVAGQVSGVVTSAGGSASLVLANTSSGISAETGDSDFSNDEAGFVGLHTGEDFTLGAPLE